MALFSSVNPLTAYGFVAARITGLLDNSADRIAGMFRQDAAAVSTPLSPASAKVVVEPDAASGGEVRFLMSPETLSPEEMAWENMRQDGPLGFNDCQVISVAAALAKTDQDAAGNLLRQVKASYLSKRKAEAAGGRAELNYGDTVFDVGFKRGTVRITPRMYFRSLKRDRLVHAHDSSKPGEVTWIALVEKAYAAEWGKEYDAIADQGPGSLSTGRVCFDLWGSFDQMFDNGQVLDNGDPAPLAKRIEVWLAVNQDIETTNTETFSASLLSKFFNTAGSRPTVATTPSFPAGSDPLTDDFIGQHTYVVLGQTGGDRIEFWEPMRHTKRSLAPDDFFTVFDAIYRRHGG